MSWCLELKFILLNLLVRRKSLVHEIIRNLSYSIFSFADAKMGHFNCSPSPENVPVENTTFLR